MKFWYDDFLFQSKKLTLSKLQKYMSLELEQELSLKEQFEALMIRGDKLEIQEFLNNQNISEVAEYLSMAKSSIYKMTSERNIPHFKTGKKLLFKRSELDEWLTENKISTHSEIEKEADNYIMRKGRRKF